MSGMEARLVISAADQSSQTFARIEKSAQNLSKVLDGAGAASKALGSGLAATGHAGRDIDALSQSLNRAIKAGASLSGKIGDDVAKAATVSTIRMRQLEGEVGRIGKASNRIEMFRSLQGGFAKARVEFASTKRAIDDVGQSIGAADRMLVKLRSDLASAKLGTDKAQAAVAAARPRRADAADPAPFKAKQTAEAEAARVHAAALANERRILVEIADTEKKRAALETAMGKARTDVTRASAAYEQQRGAVSALKSEIEELSGPLKSLASSEARLQTELNGVTSAMEKQATFQRRMVEDAERSIRMNQDLARSEDHVASAAHKATTARGHGGRPRGA